MTAGQTSKGVDMGLFERYKDRWTFIHILRKVTNKGRILQMRIPNVYSRGMEIYLKLKVSEESKGGGWSAFPN